jgi:periplasmic protein TonB
MVARIPVGVATSALLHAGALTVLVLISALARAPLPEPFTGKAVVFPQPVMPRTDRATARPRRPRGGGVRRARVVSAPVAQVVPAVLPTRPLPTENPTDADVTCLGCPSREAGTTSSTEREGPAEDGSRNSKEPGNGEPLRVGSGVEAPRKLVHVAPRYPELARRAGLQGTVELECVIDPAGAVAEVRVTGGPKLLYQAAVDAVRQWHYTPTRLNGDPVPVIMTVTVHFSLRRES